MFAEIKRSVKRKNGLDVANISRIGLDYFTPNFEEELALHPKKLEELKKWLRSKMSISRGSKVLLITGPTGSGKRTAVKVLCSEMGIEVAEWDCADEYTMNFTNEQVLRQSSMSSFIHFLQDTEFSSIQRMSLKHRLLLISQLPSLLLREPKNLHIILSKVVHISRCIIVFVLPNSDSCWELCPVRLFPSPVLESLEIVQIKFNPISSTLMNTALKRVCQMMNCRYNAEQTKNIINSSFGDIRRAVNDLLLHHQTRRYENLQQRNKRLRLGKSSPKQQKIFLELTNTSIKNTDKAKLPQPNQLELFHFIGKVMYAKRAETSNKQWQLSESKLNPNAWRRYARPIPPKDDLNRLIDMSPLSAQLLTEYVFENEPHFAPSIGALSRVSSTVAELDVMVGSSFEQQPTLEKYMLDLVIRSSLLYNYRGNSTNIHRHRFYQFEKPRCREFNLQSLETRIMISDIYPVNKRSAQMATLILPMLLRITHIPISNSQFELLRRLALSANNIPPRQQLIQHTIEIPQTWTEPEMAAQLALLDTMDETPLSPGTSFDSSSQHSICSQSHQHIIDDGNEDAGDDFNYDIDEDED